MFSIDDCYEYNVLLNIFPWNTIKAGTSTHVEPIAYDGVVLLLMLLMEYRDEGLLFFITILIITKLVEKKIRDNYLSLYCSSVCIGKYKHRSKESSHFIYLKQSFNDKINS